MGLRTTVWGKPCWSALFYIALNYEWDKDENRDARFIRFFEAVGDVLPCHYCVTFYNSIVQQYPLADFLRQARERRLSHGVFRWLYKVKDLVNRKLISQEQACVAKMFAEVDKEEGLNDEERAGRKAHLQDQILYTRPSPPFEVVFSQYIGAKTDCTNPVNWVLQSCRHQ